MYLACATIKLIVIVWNVSLDYGQPVSWQGHLKLHGSIQLDKVVQPMVSQSTVAASQCSLLFQELPNISGYLHGGFISTEKSTVYPQHKSLRANLREIYADFSVESTRILY